MPKLSVFAHDLASNPIGRLSPLLEALVPLGYEIEVFGLLISGETIYSPYADKFPFRTLRSSGSLADVLSKANKLAAMAKGDLVLAGKPLMTSFFPAILASGFGGRKPLFLDVDDNDVFGPPDSETFIGFINCHIRGFKSAIAPKWGLGLYPFVRSCSAVTVSSAQLLSLYGGTIIRHGPNVSTFDPALSDLSSGRAKKIYGLATELPVIGFAGNPHPHKGFPFLLEALIGMQKSFQLLLCGPPDHPEFQRAKVHFGVNCILTGFLPNSEMPSFLAASDIVPILQRDTPYTRAQLPAKLLEAMAMAKSVICTRVGDLPDIIGENTASPRGWIVSPDSISDLRECLQELAETPAGTQTPRGEEARRWFVEHASVQANQARLGTLYSEAITKWKAARE